MNTNTIILCEILERWEAGIVYYEPQLVLDDHFSDLFAFLSNAKSFAIAFLFLSFFLHSFLVTDWKVFSVLSFISKQTCNDDHT